MNKDKQQRQARSIDTFVNLPTEEKRKEAITQTGKGRVENTSGKTLEEASTIGRVSQPGRPSTEQELEQLRSQRSQGLTTLQKQQIIQQTMLGGGR
jgi:hypothetical protein